MKKTPLQLKKLALGSAVLLAIGCASGDGNDDAGRQPDPVSSSPQPFEQLSTRGDALGWSELYLGMTRAEIEARTGKNVSLSKGEGVGCGEYYGELRHDGRTVNLQMARTNGSDVLDSIFVEMTPRERSLGMELLAEQLKQRLSVEYEPSRHRRGEPDPPSSGFYLWTANPEMAVLIKPDRGYYVTRAGCVD